MKQIILQSRNTSGVSLIESPVPMCSSNRVLVRNVNSLISVGTERSALELGKKSLIGKAKARPDLLKRFIAKAKNEGLVKTFKTSMQMLDSPVPLGYSSAGVVVEVGKNVSAFSVGDRVACIGAGFASHAEYISMPEKLISLIPYNVNYEEASFGMLGIIAMHGIRCADLTFGETVAVVGLGLLGQLTVQILKSYGCTVVGLDTDPSKAEIATKFGVDYASGSEEDFKNYVDKVTNGYGADAVIITAATTSDRPINLSVDIARFRAKVVVVGVADIHPNRNEMWHKEVEIIVSKASGPGVLDPLYENKGIDLPLGYVRWTENRNLSEFLRLISLKSVNVTSLVSHRYDIKDASPVYKDMVENNTQYVGVLLGYPDATGLVRKREVKLKENSYVKHNGVNLGVIGAGLFGRALLLPELKDLSGISLSAISTASSSNAYQAGTKYGFEKCTTNYTDVVTNPDINAVMIITPHSTHAKMVNESLQSGKHVFVEKPLCVNADELKSIVGTYNKVNSGTDKKYLMVGYNRRFSPHIKKIISYLKNRRDPMVINYRVNAGYVPPEHWVHSEEEGGSRVIGEICHFVDLMQALTLSDPETAYAERIRCNNKTAVNSDNVVITLKFMDGSVGSILYSASGDKAFNRELIEVFCEGKSIIVKDFKRTEYYYNGKKKVFKTFNQDAGYKDELKYFFNVVKGQVTEDYSPQTMFVSTQTVFAINRALETGKPQKITIDV